MTLLLNALKGVNSDRPPIWLMRQAGRYQPSYQALRKKYSLETLFHEPELIAKVTQLPVNELGVDAAILFSDILIPLEMLGYKVTFPEGGPLVLPHSITPPRPSSLESVAFVGQAVSLLRNELRVPLIGFCGGPLTVASYIFESKLKGLKAACYEQNAKMHALLDEITKASIDYLKMQVEAGAEVIQLFDSWAGTLPLHLVETFSLPYLKRIVEAMSVPVIVFSRGSGHMPFHTVGADCMSVDWTSSLPRLREKHPTLCLQGNLDPEVLYGSKETIAKEVSRILETMRGDTRFIFNLGHGLLPDIPYENVRFLCEYFFAASNLQRV